MEQAFEFELIPVIELEPSSYSVDREYQGPHNGDPGFLTQWHNYNMASYADSGLDSIAPIEKGSWLFKIENLTSEQLEIILNAKYHEQFEDYITREELLADPREYAPLIPGGFLVILNHQILSRPGCCSGLETIEEWEVPNDGGSGEIWTGHDKDDLVFAQRAGNQLFLKIGEEQEFELSIQKFRSAYLTAKNALETFISLTSPLLNKVVNCTIGSKLARAMIYK